MKNTRVKQKTGRVRTPKMRLTKKQKIENYINKSFDILKK